MKDIFGTQFFCRLLMLTLEFLGYREVAGSQAVCHGWILPEAYLNTVFRSAYCKHWGVETGDSKQIAPGGTVTPWLVRCRRAVQTENNWKSGRFVLRKRDLTKTNFMGWPARGEFHVRATCLCVAGDVLLMGDESGYLRRLDLDSLEFSHQVRVQVSSSVRLLVCAGEWVFADYGALRQGDPVIKSFRISNLEEKCQFQGNTGSVRCMSSNGNWLVAGGYSHDLCIWRAATGELITTVFIESGINSVAVDWHRGKVFAGTFGGDVAVIEFDFERALEEKNAARLVQQVKVSRTKDSVRSIVLNGDAQLLALDWEKNCSILSRPSLAPIGSPHTVWDRNLCERSGGGGRMTVLISWWTDNQIGLVNRETLKSAPLDIGAGRPYAFTANLTTLWVILRCPHPTLDTDVITMAQLDFSPPTN